LGANRNVECQREAERSIKPPSRDWVLRIAAAAESWRAAIHGKGSQGRSKTGGPVPKSDKECESSVLPSSLIKIGTDVQPAFRHALRRERMHPRSLSRTLEQGAQATPCTRTARPSHPQGWRASAELIMRRSWSRYSLLPGLGLLLISATLGLAQPGLQLPPMPMPGAEYAQRKARHDKVLDRYPQNPSLPPAFAIPVGPLGFSVPGDNYLLRRQQLVSLDFVGEDRILFTFHVSGLMERDDADLASGSKQQIRAVMLALPTGKVEATATWTVPDRSRYLWMLNDGHFLLRTTTGLDEGNAQLQTSPSLRLPGRLLWIQMDPRQQILIANSLEPATAAVKPDQAGPSAIDASNTAPDAQKQASQGVLVVRTLNRASGNVIRVLRVPWTSQTVDWPLNSGGYLEKFHESGAQWVLKLVSFSKGDRVLAHVASTCPPQYAFTSDSALLVTSCDPAGGWKLAAMSTTGDILWDKKIATNTMWPLLTMTPNGSRVARETLILNHSADKYKRLLTAKDVQGQVAKVFDGANDKPVLEAPLTPIFDGGGNVAISPSGQRVAILSAGAIQVFQLPAPSPPATPKGKKN
jgi:hypothetical protein